MRNTLYRRGFFFLCLFLGMMGFCRVTAADYKSVFDLILAEVSAEQVGGSRMDESFLMWFTAEYGSEAVYQLAGRIADGRTDGEVWHEITGKTIRVLWLDYCRYMGIWAREADEAQYLSCADEKEAVLSFTGDFNLADGWCTTEHMAAQADGIRDCFSEDLLYEMNRSDFLMMNNEFVLSSRGEPLLGKPYAFRAKPEMADLLDLFGVDLLNLANNHVYDYGEDALLDTMEILREKGYSYIGAGENIEEASKILYYVMNGRKIAIVSATEIERSKNYTKQATGDSAGVLKTLDPSLFIEVIRKAKKTSDLVIAVVHWGTEGNLFADAYQKNLARQLAGAGADAIIGGHPHRLQGAAYVEHIPVAYSLGNFWFSDGALYTTVAQVVIDGEGGIRLKFLPCEQRGLKTRLLTGEEERDGFYQYLSAISPSVEFDGAGIVYEEGEAVEPGSVRYTQATSRTRVTGGADNDGKRIDIVGNYQ